MKLSITQENLNKALSAVSRVVGNRSTLPVLANVMLQTKNNRLKLAATNLEIGITYWIGAKVDQEGSVTMPAKLLSEYVASLPAGNVSLTTEKNNVKIECGSFSSKINGIDADEFPSIPEVKGDVKFKLAGKVLKEALSQVVLVTSTDDSRPVLTGVYLYTKDGTLYAVATDSYRLAEKKVADINKECALIIPARTIQELLRLVNDDEEVEIKVDENQVSFVFGDMELVSRLIDGSFPDYKQLIPEEVPTKALVATEELSSVTKVTGLFARENAGSLNLKVEDGKLSMNSIASQIGENNSEINAEVEGEDIEISLNGRYISDALSVIEAGKVQVGLTGKVNPCILRPIGDDSYLHIVMPLRS